MPSVYNGANAYPTGITIPSDGDPKPAATVTVALSALADRTTWLNGYFTGANSISGGATLRFNHGNIDGNGSSAITWAGSASFTGGGSLSGAWSLTGAYTLNILGPYFVRWNSGAHLVLDSLALATIAAGSTVTSDALATWTGGYTFDNLSAVVFNGTMHCTSAVQCDSTFQCGAASSATFQGSFTIGATASPSLQAPVTCSGLGRVRKPRATAVNGNTNYKWGGGGGSTALGEFIHFVSTLGGNIVWTLDEAGAGDGDTVDIYTTDANFAGHTITIATAAGGSTNAVLDGTLGFRAARMVFDGGTGKWRRACYLE